jgi:hypothetical protein
VDEIVDKIEKKVKCDVKLFVALLFSAVCLCMDGRDNGKLNWLI